MTLPSSVLTLACQAREKRAAHARAQSEAKLRKQQKTKPGVLTVLTPAPVIHRGLFGITLGTEAERPRVVPFDIRVACMSLHHIPAWLRLYAPEKTSVSVIA